MPVPRARPAVARPKNLADSGFSPGDEVSVLKWGSVIATGSVVTKDIPSNSIVIGNPARVHRARFDADTLAAHRKALLKNGFD